MFNFASKRISKFHTSIFWNARIKLTTYYLGIIAFILLIFSILVYKSFVMEFRKGFRERNIPTSPEAVLEVSGEAVIIAPALEYTMNEVDTKIFEEAKRRTLLDLMLLNASVLALSGIGGYFLAGRTLKPIEEMVEDQKRFISDASHELRTPLTALKTEIEVALKDKKITLQEAKDLLASNLEEADKMHRLSNYLLALSRYQGSDCNVKKSRLNLKESAQKVVDSFETVAVNKRIKIKTKLENVYVVANEMSLSELLTILVDNAVKYSRKGGEVSLKVRKVQKNAMIEVKDQGIGIRSSDIPFIFNRFYRADSSRSKEKVDGYGLGLSIAKAIVESSGGEINVTSKIEEGSVFAVKLPLAS